ncbi:MAG: hypothetical protein HY774_23140 [Acidobacteria bacterium]|nr:hypothetical protein [Acidobacteriota bacterium]
MKVFVFFVLFALLANVPVAASPQNQQQVIEPFSVESLEEEYSVYTAILNRYLSPTSNVQVLVLRDFAQTETESKKQLHDRVKFVSQNLPALEKKTASNFKKQNRKPFPLQERFTLSVPVHLISDEEFRQLVPSAADWSGFYKAYPGSPGLLTFSRVGFNRDLTQAVVYLSQVAGPLGGEGVFVLLQKENGVWTPTEEITVWIS